jgi:hypothetical protein
MCCLWRLAAAVLVSVSLGCSDFLRFEVGAAAGREHDFWLRGTTSVGETPKYMPPRAPSNEDQYLHLHKSTTIKYVERYPFDFYTAFFPESEALLPFFVHDDV